MGRRTGEAHELEDGSQGDGRREEGEEEDAEGLVDGGVEGEGFLVECCRGKVNIWFFLGLSGGEVLTGMALSFYFNFSCSFLFFLFSIAGIKNQEKENGIKMGAVRRFKTHRCRRPRARCAGS